MKEEPGPTDEISRLPVTGDHEADVPARTSRFTSPRHPFNGGNSNEKGKRRRLWVPLSVWAGLTASALWPLVAYGIVGKPSSRFLSDNVGVLSLGACLPLGVLWVVGILYARESRKSSSGKVLIKTWHGCIAIPLSLLLLFSTFILLVILRADWSVRKGQVVADYVLDAVSSSMKPGYFFSAIAEAAFYSETRGIHKLVAVDVSREHGHRHEWGKVLPESWAPDSLSQLELVLWVRDTSHSKRADYGVFEGGKYKGPAGSIDVIQHSVTCYLREAKTGHTVASRDFGAAAVTFPTSKEDAYDNNFESGEVSWESVRSWLMA